MRKNLNPFGISLNTYYKNWANWGRFNPCIGTKIDLKK